MEGAYMAHILSGITEGFTTWPIRDWIIVAVVVFNAGGLVYMLTNHMKHYGECMEDVKLRLRALEADVAWIKGHLKRNDRVSQ